MELVLVALGGLVVLLCQMAFDKNPWSVGDRGRKQIEEAKLEADEKSREALKALQELQKKNREEVKHAYEHESLSDTLNRWNRESRSGSGNSGES